jgi:hypothetical protein
VLSILIENLNQVNLYVNKQTEDKNQKEKIAPDELKKLLEELGSLLEKRKPKSSKEIIEKIGKYKLPDKFEIEFENLSKIISKYKFKEAMEILKVMMKY